ncbi:hypothetical protein [Clostridium sp. KNHs214]|uniref:hypothetical protein n=1 Tax=Clostridium sp. KNHs214 TaxID=1540257 RepID=UPI000554F665|nr:hypothetical protein [Clostridium sp. KNHs214]
MNFLKIDLSKEAKNKLMELLKKNPSYSCIKIDYLPQCGNSHVDLCLDEFKSEYIIDEVDDLFFMYKDYVPLYISSISVIYENSNFMLKAIPINKNKSKETTSKCCKTSKCENSCSCNNKSNCNNCSGNNDSKCSNCSCHNKSN